MSHARVRRLFSKALLDYTELNGLAVFLDNVPRVDINGNPLPVEDNGSGLYPTAYIKAHLIPADTFTDTLSGDHTGYIGMFQVTIITEYGTGSLRSEEIIEELQDIFRINELFVDTNGFAVQVISPVKSTEGRKNTSLQWEQHAWFDYRADKDTSVAHLIKN